LTASSLKGTSKESVHALCVALGITADSYRIGISKVFLRRAAHDKLELARSSKLLRYAVALQASVRRLSVRSRYMAFIKQRRHIAGVVLQSVCRRTLCQPHYIKLLVKLQAQHRESAPSAVGSSVPAAAAPVIAVPRVENREVFEIPIGADADVLPPPQLIGSHRAGQQRSAVSSWSLLDILREMNAATSFSDIQRLLQSLAAFQARGCDNFDEKDRACVDEAVVCLHKRQNLCLLQEQAERNAVNEKQYELNQSQQILLQIKLEEQKKTIQRSQG
jgi:hypothetical protein